MAPQASSLSVILEGEENKSVVVSKSIEPDEFKEKNERSKKILKDIRQLIESIYIHL